MRSFAVLCLCATITHAQVPVPEQAFDVSDVIKTPAPMCTDGKTIWVANFDCKSTRDPIYAYDFFTKRRRPEHDFFNLSLIPAGIWTDGRIMWVADWGGIIHAYDLHSKIRLPEKAFAAVGIERISGIWSDGKIMWVAEEGIFRRGGGGQILAYNLETKERVPEEDFDSQIMREAGNTFPLDLWSDGKVMWVADDKGKIYAYLLKDKSRLPIRDINLLGYNWVCYGIFSDGRVMWVSLWAGDPLVPWVLAYSMTPPTKLTFFSLWRGERIEERIEGIALYFPTYVGETYELQSSPDLINWETLRQGTATYTTGLERIDFTESGFKEKYFYRVISR